MKKLLTIAGSDSSGGAGIQADLKTFAALGTYGMSCICALTAQNTKGVSMVVNTPISLVKAQLEAIYDDVAPDAVKTGMLGTTAIVNTVSDFLGNHRSAPLIVDPVMVATSGDKLLEDDAIALYKEKLIPLAALITPNIPEAEVLSGISITSEQDCRKAAEILMTFGCEAVLIKGGHHIMDADDLLYDGKDFIAYPGERIDNEKYPRYRLHPFKRHRGKPRQRTSTRRCNRGRQGLPHRRHRACEDRLRRSRPWSRPSFLVLWRYMGENEMSYPFFAYMSRLKYIARWGLMRSTIPENDAEHTLQTAMIAHALALIRQDIFHEWADPEHCAMLALYHDASEVFTGDLPTPVKYFTPGLHEKYEEIETEARKKLLATLPEELQESYASYLVTLEQDPLWPLVKAADTLSAFLKCAEEVRDGNPEFQEAYRTTRKKLEDLHMKEVDWFLARFAKSFEKTLDQLNQKQ